MCSLCEWDVGFSPLTTITVTRVLSLIRATASPGFIRPKSTPSTCTIRSPASTPALEAKVPAWTSLTRKYSAFPSAFLDPDTRTRPRVSVVLLRFNLNVSSVCIILLVCMSPGLVFVEGRFFALPKRPKRQSNDGATVRFISSGFNGG